MPQRLPRVPDIADRLPRLESLFSPDATPLTTSMADAPIAEYEPTSYLATPGSSGGQRLLVSGRVGS
jgi:hypothetical protein